MARKKKKWNPESYITDPLYITLKDKVIKNNQYLSIPHGEPILNKNINFTSFDIHSTKFKSNPNDFTFLQSTSISSNKVYRCFKLDIKFNSFQKEIIKNWRRAYIFMYNVTLTFLKKEVKPTLNKLLLRDDFNQVKELNQKIIDIVSKICLIEDKIFQLKKLKKNEKEKVKDELKLKELEVEKLKKENEEYKKKCKDLSIQLNQSLIDEKIIFSFSKGCYNINYKNVRTFYLKEVKEKIKKDSIMKDDDFLKFKNFYEQSQKNNSFIMPHTLDNAIKLACANFQSALTNLERGYIKKFYIRYWKLNKLYQILDIENDEFRDRILKEEEKNILRLSEINNIKIENKEIYQLMCPTKLGKVHFYYKNKEIFLDCIDSDCKIYYDSKQDHYKLLIPFETTKEEILTKPYEKSFISLDPGLRTFLTGLTYENEVLDIFKTKDSKLEEYLKKKEKYENNKNLGKGYFYSKEAGKKIYKRRKNIIKTLERKIKNLVTEIHWKIIQFLTDNYKHILLGDMSTKGIVNSKTSILSKIQKDLAYTLSFYTFREKLQYKCHVKGNLYYNVREKFTSKTCSCCGHYKKDLGGNKLYECLKCGLIIDRDVNSCRNILLKTVN